MNTLNDKTRARPMMRAASLLLLSLAAGYAPSAVAQTALTAAQDGPLPSEADEDTHRRARAGGQVTIRGKVVYPDHRNKGQHGRRDDIMGDPGVPSRDRASDEQDLLGAYYVMVDAYERDTGYRPSPTCSRTEQVGRAMVQHDGSFAVSFVPRDPCATDDWANPRFALRLRLRYCDDDVCFQVGPRADSYYELWYRYDDPFTVAAGSSRDVGTLLFSEAGGDERNDHARAANQYASLVDAIVTLHREEGIPFRKSRYGKVQVRYPSRWSSGRATAADLIDLDNSGWPDGGKAIHEYGHIVHRRAWGGDYAGHEDPIQAWGPGTVESPFIAFKEGWANFIERYVTGKCFRSAYDTGGLRSLDRPQDGIQFPENHHRFLCDWVDAADDDRSGNEGIGDVFTASLYSLWHNLDRTDDTIDAYGGHDPVDPGLNVCDMLGYYLDVRKSTAEVGALAHDQYVWWVANLLDNNDISCRDVPAPSALRAYDFSVSARPVAVDESRLSPSGDGPMTVRLEATVANVHPFIASGRGLFRVDDVATGDRLTAVWVLDLAPGSERSIAFDVEVDVVDGRVVSRGLELQVEDYGREDVDLSNNTLHVTLNDDTLRPNLTLTVLALDFDEETSAVQVTAEVTNDGVGRAEVSGPLGGGALPVWMVDSAGERLDRVLLVGALEAGAAREVTMEGTLSAEAQLGLSSSVDITVDPRDVVDETVETDNTQRSYIGRMARLPHTDLVDGRLASLDWIRVSLHLAEIQHDLLRGSLVEDSAVAPWMFASEVDRAFAGQLAETIRPPMGYALPDLEPGRVELGVALSVMPIAASSSAAALSMLWRMMP